MTKFICTGCGKIWFSADNRPGQKCEECGAELKEEDIKEDKKK